MPRGTARLRALSLAAIALCAFGCGARYARVPLVATPDLVVTLRSEKRGGAAVPRGFAQPATIPAQRLESMLSRIDVREAGSAGDESRAAFPSELLPTLASALSDALARADATQEVALRAERRERRLGVFTRRFATSFVAFVDADDRLEVHLVDADRELPAGDDTPLPEPVAGRSAQAIKTLPGPQIATLGQRAVAIEWRATLFEAPPTHDAPGRRRTILMESHQTPATVERARDEAAPASADPERLRALAELDALRRSGAISEAEYQRRRAALLQPAGS